MKYPFVLLALLLPVSGAKAQALATPARPDSLVAAPAAPDTAAAIHRLFAKRRLRRNLIAGSLGAGALVGAIISASSTNDGASSSSGGSFGGAGLSFDGSDYFLLYAIPLVPLILLDFAVYANYSRKRERWVIGEFEAHRLSARMRHKLKPRYFR